MSASDELLYDIEDGIGVVTFNRPQARNALTFAMYEGLAEICAGIAPDGPVRALIITGAGGKAFAAGTDIAQFRAFKTRQDGITYEEKSDGVFQALEQCPVPTIAAIAGACTGGGAAIAACCDLRIGARDTKYGFPIARTLGNMLSAATLRRLVAVVGQSRVADMLLTARLIEADEGRQIGLLNEICDDHGQALARAHALGQQMKEQAPLTMRATKDLLRALRDTAGEVDDRELIGTIYTSEDFREGMEAFIAKRKPQWKGR